MVRIVQLEFVREEDRVDLVDDLFCLLDRSLNRLFLGRTERLYHILLPDHDELLQDVDVVYDLREAAHSDTATGLLKVPKSARFKQCMACIVAVAADK